MTVLFYVKRHGFVGFWQVQNFSIYSLLSNEVNLCSRSSLCSLNCYGCAIKARQNGAVLKSTETESVIITYLAYVCLVALSAMQTTH